MIEDNQWHPGVCVEHADGSFGIYDSLSEAMGRPTSPLPKQRKYQDIKYTWNNGEPEVDFGDLKASIVDLSGGRMKSGTSSGTFLCHS